MRKILVSFLILLFSACQVKAYSIEGSWKLTDIQQSRLREINLVRMEVKDFVFRNTTLRWTLTLTGCQYLKTMMDIKGKNIFIDENTIYLDNEKSKNCSSALVAPEQRFRLLLKKTFTFQIISTFMIFSDPDGQVLFKFQRIPSNASKVNLIGAWMATTPSNRGLSQMLQLSENQVIFCQRFARINYTVPIGNKIQFESSPNIAMTCTNNELLSFLKTPLYYAKRNNTIQLYNQKDELTLSLAFLMDLGTAQKLREEQQKAKQQTTPPPPPPTLPAVLVPAQISQPKPELKPRPSLSMVDLIGKWSISKVFSGPSIVSSMVFIITRDAFLISGDCNTYTFVYSVTSTDPIKIKRQSFRQTQNTCSNEDEQIYKTGLIKVVNLNPQTLEDKIIVKLQDDKGQEVFQIQKTNQVKTFATTPSLQSLSQPPPPPRTPITPPSPPSPPALVFTASPPSSDLIPDGKYTILLLMRRDIPKKITTIKNNSFVLKICNQILCSINLRGETMSIRTEVKTSNTCDTTQESLFLSNLGKVRGFVRDELDYILKDQNNKQIVTLNFVG